MGLDLQARIATERGKPPKKRNTTKPFYLVDDIKTDPRINLIFWGFFYQGLRHAVDDQLPRTGDGHFQIVGR